MLISNFGAARPPMPSQRRYCTCRAVKVFVCCTEGSTSLGARVQQSHLLRLLLDEELLLLLDEELEALASEVIADSPPSSPAAASPAPSPATPPPPSPAAASRSNCSSVMTTAGTGGRNSSCSSKTSSGGVSKSLGSNAPWSLFRLCKLDWRGHALQPTEILLFDEGG